MRRSIGIRLVSLAGFLIVAGCEAGPTRPAAGERTRLHVSPNQNEDLVQVCPGHDDAYASIAEGLAVAASGGTVEICPGDYPERLVIDRGVTIAGSASGTVRIAPPTGGSDRAVLVTTAEPVVMTRMTIEFPAGWGILANGRFDVTLERMTFLNTLGPTGLFNDAAVSGGRSRAVITRSVFDGGAPAGSRTGPFVGGDVDGVLDRNVVRRTTFSCIQVQSGAADFGVSGATAPVMEVVRNDVDECGLAGGIRVRVNGGSVVDVLSNTIRNTTASASALGIIFGFQVTPGQALGRIEANTIVGYVQPGAIAGAAGIQITGVARPVVRFNDIAGNAHAGLRTSPSGPPIDARCNWWGTADGPSGDGPGSGDAVFGTVTVLPFAPGTVAEHAGDADRRACRSQLHD